MPRRHRIADHVGNQFHFAAAAAVVFHKQRRVTAELPQAGQDRQNLDPALVKSFGFDFLFKLLPRTHQPRRIEPGLFRRHRRAQPALDFFRQFLQYGMFHPAQQERTDMPRQFAQHRRVGVFGDRRFKPFDKRGMMPQIAGHDIVKDRP